MVMQRLNLADLMEKMFFSILAAFSGFEGDLICLRTKEGMETARAKGKFRGFWR
ncbi:recombinase family protein [Xenorhabdus nematophila]|nr:hypothetical protein D3790_07955 [Xenorhabdus nematophila]CCW31824.1 hypothetical protein XNC3_2810003 [Xenorhabdus nematophila F1]CEE93558.1 hypothetical protein XNA1_3990004 [Xenorhabdus nematophila str. Anatoliense]MBA0019066.1 recombinase family protein [Xenorhabdus nematophila]MCB4424442.1 recombinase family protein [Xenorhabdus nematophila]